MRLRNSKETLKTQRELRRVDSTTLHLGRFWCLLDQDIVYVFMYTVRRTEKKVTVCEQIVIEEIVN